MMVNDNCNVRVIVMGKWDMFDKGFFLGHLSQPECHGQF